jgi:tape measure domain-containing protein
MAAFSDDIIARLKVAGGGQFNSAMRGAASSSSKAGTAISGAGSKARAGAKSFDLFQRSSEKTGRSLSRHAVSIAAYAGGFYVAQRAITGAIGAGIKYDASLESNRMAYQNLLHSQSGAVKLQKQLFTLASQTPFTQEGINSAAKQLLAFGFSSKGAVKALKSISGAAASFGGDSQLIDQMVRAFGQIRAKGFLQGDEVLQLQEAGVNVRKYLKQAGLLRKTQVDTRAQSLNVAIAQAKYNDAVKKGGKYSVGAASAQSRLITAQKALAKAQKPSTQDIGAQHISSAKAIQAITAGMTHQYGKMAKVQSKTFSGQLSTLEDNAKAFAGQIELPVFNALSRSVLPAANKLFPLLKDVWDRTDLSFGEKLQVSGREAQRAFKPFEDAIVRADIPGRLEHAIETGAPKVAAATVPVAERAASTFVSAWWNADPLVKILSAGVILKKLGGFKLAGAAAAKAFGSALGGGGKGGGGGLFSRGASPVNPLFVAVVNGKAGGGFDPVKTATKAGTGVELLKAGAKAGVITAGIAGFAGASHAKNTPGNQLNAFLQGADPTNALGGLVGTRGLSQRVLPKVKPGMTSAQILQNTQKGLFGTESLGPKNTWTQGIPRNPAAGPVGQHAAGGAARSSAVGTAPFTPNLTPFGFQIFLDGKELHKSTVKQVRKSSSRSG